MTYSLSPGMSTLGTVNKESHTKDAQLFQMPMPVSDSSSAIVIDLFGVSNTIELGGVYVGTNSSDVQSFVAALEALCNGNQSGQTFTSEKRSATYKVYVSSVNWDAEEGAPLVINYTINMIEGA
jgi:hypothetical protein